MPVILHHCFWDRGGTRKQWDRVLPSPHRHAAGRCAKEAGVFLPDFPEVWAQPHAHRPTWVHHYFLVISPAAGSLPQHMGHKRAQVLSCRGFRHIFPFIPAEQPAYTARWLFGTGRKLFCSVCAILSYQGNWAWEKKEHKKVAVR